MTMLVVYETISHAKLRKQAKTAIRQINEWFKSNPKRRVCRAELWYGNTVSIKRATVKEQIDKLVEKLIKTR